MRLNVSGAVTTQPTIPAGESVNFAGVPPGTCTLSVQAQNNQGVGVPSNPVTLTFPEHVPARRSCRRTSSRPAAARALAPRPNERHWLCFGRLRDELP
jgi:hypothetical protein